MVHKSLFVEKDRSMKQPLPAKKGSSVSKWFFLTSLLVLVASCAAFGVIMHLNRTIKVAGGKVVDSYTKKSFATRKQTYDQEYDVVRYSIDGKEYTGTVAAPRSGGSQYATVFYYQGFPQFAWYNKKSNPMQTYSALLAVLAAAIMVFSLQAMRKRPETAVVRDEKKSQPQKRA
jgi:hypothetical protein